MTTRDVPRARSLAAVALAGGLFLSGCWLLAGDEFGLNLYVHNASSETVYVQSNPNSPRQLVVAQPGVMGGVAFVDPGTRVLVLNMECRVIGEATVPSAEMIVLLSIDAQGLIRVREASEDEFAESPKSLPVTDACAAR